MCCKEYMKWANKKLKNIDIFDIKLIKLSVAGFILMVAKLWPGILILDWYWYMLIGIIAMIRPMKKICCNKK